MPFSYGKSLPLIALATALSLAACNKPAETTDNVEVDVANAFDPEGADFNEAPEVSDLTDSTTEAITVAAVPKPPTRNAETVPLDQASDVEDDIRAGEGIERIRYGQGWAWTRNGRIIRTADQDGRNVAYFRPGDDRPFFVQRGDRSYAYDRGRPIREFDRDGRARAPDRDRTREATEAAERAREQRRGAEEARTRAHRRHGTDRPAPTPSPTASPTPTPSPSPSATPRWRDRDGPRGERPHGTPSPQTSDRPRRDRRDGN